MPGIAYVAFVVWPLVGGAPAIGGALLANIANAIGGQVLFFSGVFLGSRFQVLNAFYNLFLGVTLATGVGSFAMALLYYRLGKLTFREAALHFLVGTATGYFFMMHGGGKAVGGAYSLIKWFEFFGLWQVPMALMTAVQITDRESFP